SLIIANFFSAFSGGIYVQYSGFYSIWGNVGTLISALAGCMIAELLAINIFFTSILGAIIYQLIINTTIEMQIEPSWQKLITGLLIILILLVKRFGNNQKKRPINNSSSSARAKSC
ncbi:MAG: hypothetical protein K2X39_02760, partial [Silvanigrellaceae bacterium]|nr:hypothetical protein [Silvanigrellaceae bacterium]